MKYVSKGDIRLIGKKTTRGYEWLVTLLFFLLDGCIFFDRLHTSYASVELIETFGLSNTQYALFGSLFAVSFALSAIVFGYVSDRTGKRKGVLAPLCIIGGIATICSIFFDSYIPLLVIRFITGFCVGVGIDMMMAILLSISSPKTFGLNSGIMAAGVAVIAQAIGPTLITRLVTASGWRASFALTGALLLAAGLATQLFVREIAVDHVAADTDNRRKGGLSELFRNRNFLVCCLLGIFGMAGYQTGMLFVPLYLTGEVGASVSAMGTIASISGTIFIIYSILIPVLSDKIGRKKALLLSYAISALSPLFMYLFTGQQISVVAYIIAGGMPGALTPIYACMIPMESLPDHLKTSACGFVIGIAEIVGGTIWPAIAGAIADTSGYKNVMGVAFITFVIAGILCVLLRETSPVALAQRREIQRTTP